MDDIDISYYGSADSRRTRHVADVSEGMFEFACGPSVEEDVDFDFWHYRYYGERPYVENLCALPEYLVHSWRGRYIVHIDALRGTKPSYQRVFATKTRRSRYIGRNRCAGNSLRCRHFVGSYRTT